MEENKGEEKEVTVYNIPGVIIPEQMTDKGIIKGNGLENSNVQSDVNKDIVQNSVASQTVSNNTNNVINNETPVPNVRSAPINTVVIKSVVPTPQVVQPSVSFQNTPPINNQNMQNSQNTVNSKKSREPIYIGLIVVLLGALFYFIYTDFLAPREEVDPVKELERTRSMNINSLLVQTLYNYIDLDGCGEESKSFYSPNNQVLAKDLTYEFKNYLAYKQLLNKDIRSENCSNFSKALHKNDKVSLWYCGEEYLKDRSERFNDEASSARVFLENTLKKQVEAMFGPASYKAITFPLSTSLRYLYDDKTSSYILQSFYGGDTCKGYTNKLEKAYRKKDDITIVVKVKNNESKKLQLFYYTFTESEDGNYYFNTLNKGEA